MKGRELLETVDKSEDERGHAAARLTACICAFCGDDGSASVVGSTSSTIATVKVFLSTSYYVQVLQIPENGARIRQSRCPKMCKLQDSKNPTVTLTLTSANAIQRHFTPQNYSYRGYRDFTGVFSGPHQGWKHRFVVLVLGIIAWYHRLVDAYVVLHTTYKRTTTAGGFFVLLGHFPSFSSFPLLFTFLHLVVHLHAPSP